MMPRGGFVVKASRRSLRKTKGARDAIAELVHADPAKALVMDFIAQLVAEGFAEWEMLSNGEIEIRFNTGEIFILAKTVVVRMA